MVSKVSARLAGLLEHQIGDAAHAVAAGAGLRAVIVVDAHEGVGAGRARRMQRHQLVVGRALRPAAARASAGADGARLAAQVDHHDLVAETVHLDEGVVGERAHDRPDAAIYEQEQALGQWAVRWLRHANFYVNFCGNWHVSDPLCSTICQTPGKRWGRAARRHEEISDAAVHSYSRPRGAVGAPVPSLAQTTVQTQPIDPFGQEVTLAEQTIVYAAGTGEWDTALETLTEAFKTVKQYLDKAGLKAAGPAMTIYTAMDDISFNFQAAIPVAAAPKAAPTGDILTGTSPAGKALKFVHRGSFDAMTQTYDTISHHVDEKQISTQDF